MFPAPTVKDNDFMTQIFFGKGGINDFVTEKVVKN